MTGPGARWGIMGTANIARSAFLPGLRHAGGSAAVVAGRDLTRARDYAAAHGIGRALGSYQALIDDPDVDVLYIPLPNSLHADWTIAALRAGKPVLCEKPLCGNLADTHRVLGAARETGTLLWEAFAFPFHDQLAQVRRLVTGGAIGELTEIQSGFHFLLSRPDNIRLSARLEGGALNDVGCYPVRLAYELLGAGHTACWASAQRGGTDVDLQTWGMLDYPNGRKLLLSCGLTRPQDTLSRLLGTGGEIRLTNPFHPSDGDHFQVLVPGAEPQTTPVGHEPSFAPLIRHIQAALAGVEPPAMLAVDTALPTARALDDLARSASA